MEELAAAAAVHERECINLKFILPPPRESFGLDVQVNYSRCCCVAECLKKIFGRKKSRSLKITDFLEFKNSHQDMAVLRFERKSPPHENAILCFI
jgi:hypothetical protein